MISIAPPFVLRLSKHERRVFQQNHNFDSLFLRSFDISTRERYRNCFSSFEFRLPLSTSTFS